MLTFECPYCGRSQKAPEEHAGRFGRCKACGGRIKVPPLLELELDLEETENPAPETSSGKPPPSTEELEALLTAGLTREDPGPAFMACGVIAAAVIGAVFGALIGEAFGGWWAGGLVGALFGGAVFIGIRFTSRRWRR